MLQKNLLVVPLFACCLLLVMGALNHQPRHLAPAAGAPFVAQPISMAAGLENLPASQILARAAAALAPEKTPWLHCKTWMKQVDEEVSFEAEGRLLRGPHQCARLEMKIRTGKEPIAVSTVSDGVGLARVFQRPSQACEVNTQKFTTSAQGNMTGPQIDRILNDHGCGGPHWLLKDLQAVLENVKAEPGTWNGKMVLRLTGSLKANAATPADERRVVPRLCHLYLDAKTLWPHRIEWRAIPERDGPGFLVLQLEFRDPEINHPLSHEECVREFTYMPT